ncbi:MAG: hypothetical protein PWQ12_1748 [Clostridiales bacterium]|nr:hypothetical protein [Clostridiales bacterium]
MERSSEVTAYIEKYDSESTHRLNELRQLIHETLPEIDEKIWAGVPCFYNDEKFILLRAFKKHINIVADSVIKHESLFKEYQITPKGMLQILDNQALPVEGIKQVLGTCGKDVK